MDNEGAAENGGASSLVAMSGKELAKKLRISPSIFEAKKILRGCDGVLELSDPNELILSQICRPANPDNHWEDAIEHPEQRLEAARETLPFAKAALNELQLHSREEHYEHRKYEIEEGFITKEEIDRAYSILLRTPLVVNVYPELTQINMHRLFPIRDNLKDVNVKFCIYIATNYPWAQGSGFSVDAACYVTESDGNVRRIGRQNELAEKYNLKRPGIDQADQKRFHSELTEVTGEKGIFYLGYDNTMSSAPSFDIPMSSLGK